jgi:hypothetical protein
VSTPCGGEQGGVQAQTARGQAAAVAHGHRARAVARGRRCRVAHMGVRGREREREGSERWRPTGGAPTQWRAAAV